MLVGMDCGIFVWCALNSFDVCAISYSLGELAQVEERVGDAIECLMFGALGWTKWVKNYREICIQVRLSRRFMTRKNKVGFYVYKIEIDKEDEDRKNWKMEKQRFS